MPTKIHMEVEVLCGTQYVDWMVDIEIVGDRAEIISC